MVNESLRKIIHVLCGIILIPLIFGENNLYLVFYFSYTLLIFSIICDTLISKKIKIPILSKMIRKNENISGATFYITGIILSYVFYPYQIATTASLMMIIGDPTVWLFRNGHKNYYGMVVMTLACFIIGLLLLNPTTALIMAITAAIIEYLSENDNLTIPLITGLIGTLTAF